MNQALFILGSGGIGKSNIAELLRDDCCVLSPYRLRSHGPRDERDKYYAPPSLQVQLSRILKKVESKQQYTAAGYTIDWYPLSRVLMFQKGDIKQVLFLPERSSITTYYAIEIFPSVIQFLLEEIDLNGVLDGTVTFLLLNPSPYGIKDERALHDIQARTRFNCLARTDVYSDGVDSETLYQKLSQSKEQVSITE